MTNPTHAEVPRRLIPFTIDGKPYETDKLRQRADDLLKLAGLDPAVFDLGEVPKEGPPSKPFADDEFVVIQKDARFVSIRQSAPVT